MTDVTRIAGQAQTFPYYLRDAQNSLITPLSAPQQSIHASSADAASGANPLSGPTALTGAAGSYTCTYPAGLATGTYYLRTVTQLTASTSLIDVDDRLILTTVSGQVSSGFASLAEFKAHLNIKGTATTNDTELQGFLDASVPVIENITGPILPRTISELHDGGDGNLSRIVLRQRPVYAITSVVAIDNATLKTLAPVADQSVATALSYTLDPTLGLITRRVLGGTTPFPAGCGNIVVSYTGGYSLVPANVRLASLFQAAHLYQTSQLGGRPTLGSAAGEDGYDPRWAYAIPNRVRELLMPHQRLPGVG